MAKLVICIDLCITGSYACTSLLTSRPRYVYVPVFIIRCYISLVTFLFSFLFGLSLVLCLGLCAGRSAAAAPVPAAAWRQPLRLDILLPYWENREAHILTCVCGPLLLDRLTTSIGCPAAGRVGLLCRLRAIPACATGPRRQAADLHPVTLRV